MIKLKKELRKERKKKSVVKFVVPIVKAGIIGNIEKIKNKGGSRPQARTTVRKPRPQATGRRRMFHVKQKIKRVGPAHKHLPRTATLCPLTLDIGYCRTLNFL